MIVHVTAVCVIRSDTQTTKGRLISGSYPIRIQPKGDYLTVAFRKLLDRCQHSGDSVIGCVLRATRADVKNRLSAGESTWAVISSDSSVVDA